MADSQPVISVSGQWKDVYSASGFAVGVPLTIQVVRGNADFAISATEPTDELATRVWLNQHIQLDGGESGLWARSYGGEAELAVQDARGALKADPYVPSSALEKLGGAVDILGQMNTAEYTPLVGQKPLPGLSFLRDKLVGGDSEFSVVNGEVQIDGTPGLRSLYTKDYGLYLPGLLGLGGLRVRMSTPGSGTYRYGYGGENGDRIGLECIDGAWKTFVEAGGVRWYSKAQANWLDPLDGTGPSGLAATLNGATFRIIMGWYGGLSILFSMIIPDRENGDKLVIFDSSGPRSDGVTLENPDQPIFAEADGGVMYVGGRQYGVFGRFRPQYRVTSTRKIIKSVGETLTPIASMRVKSASRWESVPVTLDDPSVSCTVNAEHVIIIGGTLDDNTFGAIPGIDPEETALEINTAATTVTGGYRAPGDLILGGAGRQPGRSAADIPDINIPAGTIVTLAVVTDPGAGTGSSSSIMRMRELW